jgi:hypothetical protein
MYRRRKAATGVRALVTCSIAVERQQAIAKQLEEAIERAREGVSARARPQHGDPEQQLREADTGEVAFRRPARSTRPHGGIWRRARALGDHIGSSYCPDEADAPMAAHGRLDILFNNAGVSFSPGSRTSPWTSGTRELGVHGIMHEIRPLESRAVKQGTTTSGIEPLCVICGPLRVLR